MKEKLRNNIVVDLIPMLSIIIVGGFSILKWKIGVVFPILVCVLISGIIAHLRGASLSQIENAMSEGVKSVFPALITVILVGLIISSWIMGGIIPAMVYWGFKILNFNNFLPMTFIITSLVAIITGTSFTSMATIGISFMIIARQAGVPAEMVAGAVVSGAFLGDKMSPLSDTTNISAALGKTDLFEHIQYMLYDTIPAFIISLLGFKILNPIIDTTTLDTQKIDTLLSEITDIFNVTPLVFIIPLLIMFLGIKKIPSIVVLFISVVMGIVSSVIFQNFKMVEIIRNTISGTNLNFQNLIIGKLFSKGGLNESSSTVIVIIFIGCLIGIINQCGLFDNILAKIQLKIRSSKQLTISVFLVSLGIGFITGAQLLAIIIPISVFLPLFKKFKLKNKNITRIVEATGTVGITLIPWSVPGIFISKILEVNMLQVIPYLLFPITVLIMNLFFNLTEIGIAKEV